MPEPTNPNKFAEDGHNQILGLSAYAVSIENWIGVLLDRGDRHESAPVQAKIRNKVMAALSELRADTIEEFRAKASTLLGSIEPHNGVPKLEDDHGVAASLIKDLCRT